ncbi:MAG: bifunctional adenosylcobinamide kinase/adenosylcobinamide-phosphate guanylyltransferase [Clostridia bacterium]|nr:bifunctional adenosylcobinamide kinase/adenosylcobinamide-phosphate guanylyltransferase [Clostridia bacterium]
MLILVSGGSASGKSKYAEDLAVRGPEPKTYLATMKVWDGECEDRVKRHRAMRAGKGFETLECPENLAAADIPAGCTVLLEDLSNLCANEWFGAAGAQGAYGRVMDGVDALDKKAARVVIVTNELFSDGIEYDSETADYLACLARLNCAVAAKADAVWEVVCGIPICHKGIKGGEEV